VRDRVVEATLRLPLDDMDLLLRLDTSLDGTVSQEEIERARPRIFEYLREKVDVEADAGAAAPALRQVTTWKDEAGFPYVEVGVTYAAAGPIGTLNIRVRALLDLYSDHRNLAEIETFGRRETFVFQHGNRYEADRGGAAAWRRAWEFTRLGIEHIFTGYDHVLFLFGLLLVGRGLLNLVAVVTSFTLAHSLTLALATLGLVQPVSWVVEAAIALSIAYVGLENLLVSEVRHRWRITFAFGLVHGFGFASVLREMQLPRSSLMISLFTFNLGVEIGQVVIVALMWPLLRRLERSPQRRLVTRLVSALIVAFGLYWLVERIL
jgi:hydrogenase/urease accessory protein HupE